MTRLFVDQREIPSPPPGIESLEQVLKHVEETHLGPNCIIRQVSVDGLPVVNEPFRGNESTVQGGIACRETIEIVTGAIGDIAQESIREAVSYIDRVEALLPSIAASFQATPGPKAFENLRQLYEGFYWLYLLLDRLNSLFNSRPETHQPDSKSLEAHQERFLCNLRHMVQAHEHQDFVLLADLLEYEIIPLIPDLKRHFADMAVRAQ
jgi:hypothetical protein